MEVHSISDRQVFCPEEGFPLHQVSVLGLTLSGNPIPVQYGADSVGIPSSSPFSSTSAAQLSFTDITAVQLQALLVEVFGSPCIAEV